MLYEVITVRVFDVLGRNVAHVTNVSSKEIALNNVIKSNSLLIVQITLESGKEIIV